MKWPWDKVKIAPATPKLTPVERRKLERYDQRLGVVQEQVRAMRADILKELERG